MNPDLDRVIRQALADARAAGRDYLGETETRRTRPQRLVFVIPGVCRMIVWMAQKVDAVSINESMS